MRAIKEMDLSVVVPVYNSEGSLCELTERIINTLKNHTEKFEILLIEDGSVDKSWQKIEEIGARDGRIKGFKLSRNFGQHFAITAGIEHSSGEWVVVMDCDLQDQPEEISRLLARALLGCDIVLASRNQRNDGLFKRFCSAQFYRMLSFLSGTKYDHTIANFGIYHKNVIDSVKKMPEKIRFFPAMINWVGFRRDVIEVKHESRVIGESSYSFKKRLKLALDIVLAYSDKPLRLIVFLGIFFSFFAFLMGGVILFKYFSGQIYVLGYASILTSICFFSGIIISVLGIIGLYIGKIFDGIKNRPCYLIEKKTFE